MLSQVNSHQKEKNNFCIFLTHLIASMRVVFATSWGGHPIFNATPAVQFQFVPQKHRGALSVCLCLSLGVVSGKGLAIGLPPKVGSSYVLGIERSPATEQNQNLCLFFLRGGVLTLKSVHVARGRGHHELMVRSPVSL